MLIISCKHKGFSQGYDPAIQPRIDSLKGELEKDNLHDTTRIKLLYSIGEQTWLFRVSYWDTIINLAEKAKLQELSIRELRSINLFLSGALNNTGYIHKSKGDISKALEYYHRSLQLDEKMSNNEGIASSLNNIAAIYELQGDISQALVYNQRSLKISEEINNQRGIGSSLNNIGHIYQKKGEFNKALEFYLESLEISEEINKKNGIAESFNNIGSVYHDLDDIPKALDYYQRSLKVLEEINHKKGIAACLGNIGSLHLEAGAMDESKKYLARAFEVAQELKSPARISRASLNMSILEKLQGNYREALKMYELHIVMRDSIKNEETQKASIRQQTKYEFEKAQLVKEQEENEQARVLAEQTSRRDNLQYSIMLIGLLVIGGLVAMLGRMALPERVAEGLIFFAFLIFFEFILVLADPYVEKWTGGAPGLKLLVNAGVAAVIFPLHSLFERKLKGRLINQST